MPDAIYKLPSSRRDDAPKETELDTGGGYKSLLPKNFLMPEPPRLEEIIGSDVFLGASVDDKQLIVNELFKDYADYYEDNPEAQDSMFKAKMGLNYELERMRFHDAAREMLPEHLQYPENIEAVADAFRDYHRRGGDAGKPPSRKIDSDDAVGMAATHKIPLLRSLSEDEVERNFQNPQAFEHPLLPSEARRLAYRNAIESEKEGASFSDDLMSKVQDEMGFTRKTSSRPDHEALGRAGKVFEAMRRMDAVQAEAGATHWISGAADEAGDLWMIRKKPHGSKNIWQVKTGSPGRQQVRDIELPASASLATEEGFQAINSAVHDVVHKHLDDYSDENGETAGLGVSVRRSDRERAEAIVGAWNEGFLKDAWRGLKDAGSSTITGLVDVGAGMLLSAVSEGAMAGEGAMMTVGSLFSDTIHDALTKPEQSGYAPGRDNPLYQWASNLQQGMSEWQKGFSKPLTRDDLLHGNSLIREGGPVGGYIDLSAGLGYAAQFGGIIASLARGKIAGRLNVAAGGKDITRFMQFSGLMSQAGASAWGTTYEAALRNGHSEEKARLEATMSAPIEGAVMAAAMMYAQNNVMGQTKATRAIRDWTLKAASKDAGKFRQMLATGAADGLGSVVPNLVSNIVPMGIARVAGAAVHDLASGDDTLKPIRDLMTDLEFAEFQDSVFGQGLKEDLVFSLLGSAVIGGRSAYMSARHGVNPYLGAGRDPSRAGLGLPVYRSGNSWDVFTGGGNRVQFKSEPEAIGFAADVKILDQLASQWTYKVPDVNGKVATAIRPDAPENALQIIQQLSERLDRAAASSAEGRSAEVSGQFEGMIGAYDDITTAIQKAANFANEYLLGGPPLQERRAEFVSKRVKELSGLKDWEAVKQRHKQDILQGRSPENSKFAELQARVSETASAFLAAPDGSPLKQEAAKAYADAVRNRDRFSDKSSKVSEKDAEAAASDLVERLRLDDEHSQAARAEAEADAIFGPGKIDVKDGEASFVVPDAPLADTINTRLAIEKRDILMPDGTTREQHVVMLKQPRTYAEGSQRSVLSAAEAEAARMERGFAEGDGSLAGRKPPARTVEETFAREGDVALPPRPKQQPPDPFAAQRSDPDFLADPDEAAQRAAPEPVEPARPVAAKGGARSAAESFEAESARQPGLPIPKKGPVSSRMARTDPDAPVKQAIEQAVSDNGGGRASPVEQAKAADVVAGAKKRYKSKSNAKRTKPAAPAAEVSPPDASQKSQKVPDEPRPEQARGGESAREAGKEVALPTGAPEPVTRLREFTGELAKSSGPNLARTVAMELRGLPESEVAEVARFFGIDPKDKPAIARRLAQEARPGKDVAPAEKPSSYDPGSGKRLEAEADALLAAKEAAEKDPAGEAALDQAILEAESMPDSEFTTGPDGIGRGETPSGEPAFRAPAEDAPHPARADDSLRADEGKIFSPAELRGAAELLGEKSWTKQASDKFWSGFAAWMVDSSKFAGRLAELFKKAYRYARNGLLALAVAVDLSPVPRAGVVRMEPVMAEAAAKPAAFREPFRAGPPASLRMPGYSRSVAARLPGAAKTADLPARGTEASGKKLAASQSELPITPVADFAGRPASPEAVHVADWVVRNEDNAGRPFIIADKQDGLIFVFDEKGRLKKRAPALFGKTEGDYLPEPPVPIEEMHTGRREDAKITPAGRFDAETSFDEYGSLGETLDFASKSDSEVVAIHRLYLDNPAENRPERLASESANDNRVSYGCINADGKIMDKTILPMFRKNGGVVYVLPETAPGVGSFTGFKGLQASKRIGNRGSTIIFSEIADMIASGIKFGWDYAKIAAEGAARFGKEMASVIRDTYLAVRDEFIFKADEEWFRGRPEGGAGFRAQALDQFLHGEMTESAILRSLGSIDGLSDKMRADIAAKLGMSQFQQEMVGMVGARDMLKARNGSLTRDETDAIKQQAKSKTTPAKASAIGEWFDQRIRPLWKEVNDISPEIGHGILAMENRELQGILDSLNRVGESLIKPLAKIISPLGRVDQAAKAEALIALRGGKAAQDAYVALHPELAAGMAEWRVLADELHETASRAGITLGKIDDYFPFQVDSYDDFLEAIQRSPGYGRITNAWKDAQAVTPEERADIAIRILASGKPFKGRAGSLKGRTVEDISDMLDFYTAPHLALENYVHNIWKEIATQEYLGTDYLTKFKDSRQRRQAIAQGSLVDPHSKIGAAMAEIAPTLSRDQEARIIDRIHALMNSRPHSAAAKIAMSGNVVLGLAHPLKNLVQLSTVPAQLYWNGLFSWLEGVNPFSKNRVQIQADLAQGKTLLLHADRTFLSKANHEFAKWSLLRFFDAAEGGSYSTGALARLKGLDEARLRLELEPMQRYFSGSVDDVIKQIRAGNKDDPDVRYALFTKLSNIRPTSLSGMPVRWHQNNGIATRGLMYGLRTFAVHQLDLMRQETWDHFRNGRVAEGLAGTTLLLPLTALGGYSTTAASAWLMGEQVEDIGDGMAEAALKIAMASPWMLNQMEMRGPASGAISAAFGGTPMTGMADELYKAWNRTVQAAAMNKSVFEPFKEMSLHRKVPFSDIPIAIMSRLSPQAFESERSNDARFNRLIEGSKSSKTARILETHNIRKAAGEKDRKESGVQDAWKESAVFEKAWLAARKIARVHSDRKEWQKATDIIDWVNVQAEHPETWKLALREIEAEIRYLESEGFFKEPESR